MRKILHDDSAHETVSPIIANATLNECVTFVTARKVSVRVSNDEEKNTYKIHWLKMMQDVRNAK